MSSFDISSGGLKAQAAAIQVTSNNVANASTVGFKSRESLFVDQYFTAVQSGGTAGEADFGTKRVSTQGALKGTGSVLDLAVQGQGMFQLSSQVSGDTANHYYSRNGSFSVDKAGYIVNANGLFLTGYQPNATLTGTTPTIAALKMPPAVIAPLASTTGQLVVNLDTRMPAPMLVVGGVTTSTPKTFLASDPSTFNSSTTVQVYDSKGLAHQVSMFFKKVDPTVVDDPRSSTTPKAAATATQYEVYMQSDGVRLNGNSTNTGKATLGDAATDVAAAAKKLADDYATATAGADLAGSKYVTASSALTSATKAFDTAMAKLSLVEQAAVTDGTASGSLGSDLDTAVQAKSLKASVATNVAAALVEKTSADVAAVEAAKANRNDVAETKIGTLQFVDGQLVGSLTRAADSSQAAAPAIFNVDLQDANGIPLINVAIDLSDMTAFGTGFLVTRNDADGYAPGDLAGLSIDGTGQMTGQYTNGMSLVAGQLVLASFNSEAGLEPASGSVFAETFGSGAPVLGTGTAGSFGMVRSMMLEQSTTDMAAELVNLMIQQRNYQANSQGLQAANTLLTTAINLGR
jgi:flagellar hook protein FlgE